MLIVSGHLKSDIEEVAGFCKTIELRVCRPWTEYLVGFVPDSFEVRRRKELGSRIEVAHKEYKGKEEAFVDTVRVMKGSYTYGSEHLQIGIARRFPCIVHTREAPPGAALTLLGPQRKPAKLRK